MFTGIVVNKSEFGRLEIEGEDGSIVITYPDRARGLDIVGDTVRVRQDGEPADFTANIADVVFGEINPNQPGKLKWFASLDYKYKLEEEIRTGIKTPKRRESR